MAARIRDTDRGFAKLMGELGEVGTIVIGVQGRNATVKHPGSDLSVGDLARMHEFGMGGMPERSFIRAWFDTHVKRLKSETASVLQAFLKGNVSRKKGLADLGYRWTDEVRKHIDANGVSGPALAPYTRKRKGHATKLLGFTYTLRNSITYKLFLPHKKSIRNTEQRARARGQ